ncbi:hypothetical protein HN51_015358 [Arachis hypogaea]
MHLSANNLSFLAELLSFYKFPGEEIPIVRGSALSALQGTNEDLGKKAILKLMDAVDAYISDPVRQLDNRKCFLYSDEKVLNKVQEGSLPKAITSFIFCSIHDKEELVKAFISLADKSKKVVSNLRN